MGKNGKMGGEKGEGHNLNFSLINIFIFNHFILFFYMETWAGGPNESVCSCFEGANKKN